jgi:CheY-like chemotaxis protein
MKRVLLIHWNKEEANERARRLEGAGFEPECPTIQNPDAFRAIRENPPDAFVIDLSRLPSQGSGVATKFRQMKSTRNVPIVFVEGKPEKVERLRSLFPDAVYSKWRGIRGALNRALKAPPKDPRVPGTMDGYSGTPLPKKLGIRPDATVALLGAPEGFEKVLGDVPSTVRFQKHSRGRPNLILLFARNRAQLRRRFPAAARALAQGGGLWIAWPKKTSKIAADLTQTEVRAFGLERDFVDYKICSIDETWSGLLFARRRK